MAVSRLLPGAAGEGIRFEVAAGSPEPFDADSTLVHVDLARLAVRQPRGRARRARPSTSPTSPTARATRSTPRRPVFSRPVYFAEVHGFFSLLFYYHQRWDAAPPRRAGRCRRA